MTETADDRVKSEAGVVRLALVTCGPQLEVALEAATSRVVSLVRLGGVAPRSTLVLAAVDLLVEDAGLSGDSVDEVVVSRGPGSFTGIRAGLATAAGLVAAVGAKCLAYDSLLMLAARCGDPDRVWCAQPGRRGEVYARQYEVTEGRSPVALGEIEVLPISAVEEREPWIAAEALDLGDARRAATARSSAEALLYLAGLGAPADAPDPLYIEGPPIHTQNKTV
jgi:tRNA threonylcarbamoyl adenosine modification protein YeaZ